MIKRKRARAAVQHEPLNWSTVRPGRLRRWLWSFSWWSWSVGGSRRWRGRGGWSCCWSNSVATAGAGSGWQTTSGAQRSATCGARSWSRAGAASGWSGAGWSCTASLRSTASGTNSLATNSLVAATSFDVGRDGEDDRESGQQTKCSTHSKLLHMIRVSNGEIADLRRPASPRVAQIRFFNHVRYQLSD